MHIYQVGQPYSPGHTRWPERSEYNFRAGSHELRLFIERPAVREVRDVERGACEFGLLVTGDVIFLLYRFGTAVPWSDVPYSWHLVRRAVPAEATLPEPAEVPEPHDLIHCILVDASTGIIRALRVVTFSPAFTAAIRLAIREQAARPWPGDPQYDAQVDAVYRRYPTSALMLPDARARCTGGT